MKPRDKRQKFRSLELTRNMQLNQAIKDHFRLNLEKVKSDQVLDFHVRYL